MRTARPAEKTTNRERCWLRIRPDDLAALRREAVRRMEAGVARRFDTSAVLADVLAAWRGERA